MSDLRKRFSLDFLVSSKHEEYDRKTAYERGFADCKQRVLRILQQDLHNCDLSTDSCDRRYIDRVKEL